MGINLIPCTDERRVEMVHGEVGGFGLSSGVR